MSALSWTTTDQEGYLDVTNRSRATGKFHTLRMKVLPSQFLDWLRGKLAQEAFPDLSPAEREFIMTGITAEEWDAIFAPDEEDEE